jgi:hypothetical protein
MRGTGMEKEVLYTIVRTLQNKKLSFFISLPCPLFYAFIFSRLFVTSVFHWLVLSFFCRLFNDAFQHQDYISLDYMMIDLFERIWKEA